MDTGNRANNSLKYVLLSLSLFLGIGTAFPGMANVFGKDHRVVVEKLESPFQMIGALKARTETKTWPCTAFLVGPDLALTNLHCVARILASQGDGELLFLPFYNQGQSKEEATVKYIKAPYSKTKNGIRFRFTDDWALLFLDKPVGKVLGWFEVAPQTDLPGGDSPFLVSLAGYSNDIKNGEVMSVHKDCQIRNVTDRYVYHDCDMMKGASGSPIYRLGPDGKYQVVALNVDQILDHKYPSSFKGMKLPAYEESLSNLAVNTEKFYETIQKELRESLKRNP